MLETRLRNTTSYGGSTTSSGSGGTTDTSGLVQLNQSTPQALVNGKLVTEGFQFNTNPSVGSSSAGKLYWDTSSQTLSLNVNDIGTNLQIGQENYVRIMAGENIANGDAVYFYSSSGGYPLAARAIATSDEKSRVKGIATEVISTGSQGFITAFGVIHNLNLATMVSGNLVYLSGAVSGGITNVQPVAPIRQIVIGRVLTGASTDGSIYRSMSPNYPISANQIDLHKVNGSKWHSLTDWFNTESCGQIEGGEISSTSATTIQVNSGNGMIAIGTSANDPIVWCDWAAKAAFVISDNRVTWVTVNYNSGSPVISILNGSSATDYDEPAAINYQNVFPLGWAVREGTIVHTYTDPRRIQDCKGGLIRRFHQTIPIARDERVGGVMLGETGTRNITLSTGYLWERQNRFTIPALNTSVSGDFTTYYRDSSSGFIITTGATAWPNTQYDNGSGTLQTVASNRFANLWWYISLEGELFMLYGRNIYTTLAAAATGTPPATLPLNINASAKLFARTIFQGSAASWSQNDSYWTQNILGTSVATHNNLSGLQGGTSSEYYHLTNNEYTGAGSGLFVRQTSSFVSIVSVASGTTAANSAPIYLKAGTLMTVAETGAIEFDGSGLYITF